MGSRRYRSNRSQALVSVRSASRVSNHGSPWLTVIVAGPELQPMVGGADPITISPLLGLRDPRLKLTG